MPSIKFYYFDVAGRLEPTRICLTLGGVPFEEHVLTRATWNEMKKERGLAPRELPLMELDGEWVVQSLAIARWAAKLARYEGRPLYPEDPREALKVDEMVDNMNEMFIPMVKSVFEMEGEERLQYRAKIMEEGGAIQKWLAYIDAQLGKSTSGFVVGDHFTLADACIFAWPNILVSGQFDGFTKDALDPFTHIKQHTAKIAKIPELQAYYAKKEGLFSVYKG